MNLGLIIVMLITHYIADFLFQTEEMSVKKHENNLYLFWHIASYCVVLVTGWDFYWFAIQGTVKAPPTLFTFANIGSHMVIDYFTSRITWDLGQNGKYKTMFNVMGLDQLLHVCILVLSLLL